MLQVLYIFIPMLVAILVPLLYKRMKNIHTGWFVLAVPATLAIIYATYIAQVAKGKYLLQSSLGFHRLIFPSSHI